MLYKINRALEGGLIQDKCRVENVEKKVQKVGVEIYPLKIRVCGNDVW